MAFAIIVGVKAGCARNPEDRGRKSEDGCQKSETGFPG